MLKRLLVFALLLPVFAQSQDPAYASFQDIPGLPRVLLLGDSISIGYTLPVRKLLAGKANVHRPPSNCGPTSNGVKNIRAWLSDGDWSVIHFNFGLHDLKLMEDGKQQVSLDEYERNLREIAVLLKATGATIILATTTPVPNGAQTPVRRTEDVPAYNAAALRVARDFGFAVDDLYALCMPQLTEIQRPQNVHFTGKGYEVLATQVAASIQKALAQNSPKR